jgi:hypothetical protein
MSERKKIVTWAPRTPSEILGNINETRLYTRQLPGVDDLEKMRTVLGPKNRSPSQALADWTDPPLALEFHFRGLRK